MNRDKMLQNLHNKVPQKEMQQYQNPNLNPSPNSYGLP